MVAVALLSDIVWPPWECKYNKADNTCSKHLRSEVVESLAFFTSPSSQCSMSNATESTDGQRNFNTRYKLTMCGWRSSCRHAASYWSI